MITTEQDLSPFPKKSENYTRGISYIESNNFFWRNFVCDVAVCYGRDLLITVSFSETGEHFLSAIRYGYLIYTCT